MRLMSALGISKQIFQLSHKICFRKVGFWWFCVFNNLCWNWNFKSDLTIARRRASNLNGSAVIFLCDYDCQFLLAFWTNDFPVPLFHKFPPEFLYQFNVIRSTKKKAARFFTGSCWRFSRRWSLPQSCGLIPLLYQILSVSVIQNSS